jgi:hypothetical protein
MMEEGTTLKKGDKLYARTYWDDGSSEWQTVTILWIKRGRIKFAGGYGYTIGLKDIGDEWFTTKKDLILDHLETHREGLVEKEEEYKEEIAGLTREIKLLERALKRLEQ